MSKLYNKYYGKEKSKAKESKVVAKPPKEPKAKEPLRRNELMMRAKTIGIKNFRVINKQELIEILKEGTPKERINEIVAGAVARWKTGWKRSKQKTQK